MSKADTDRLRSIIVASAHLCDGELKLGSSHIARCFAERGRPTLYLNAPTSPLHLLANRSRAASLRRLKVLRPTQTHQSGLFELSPLTLLPHYNVPLLRADTTLRRWPGATMPSIYAGIRSAGFADAAAIIFDSVMFWPLVKQLGLPSVYRVADRIDGFAVNTQAMRDLHWEAVRDADFVLCTAPDLLPVPPQRTKPSAFLPNGVFAAHFTTQQPAPEAYRGLRRPIAVYAGAIEEWFDIDGLAAAARRFTDVTFAVIGPGHERLRDRIAAQNVRLLGPKAYDTLPAYLQHADIGIIPFDLAVHGRLLNAVSPLKLFEYLAAGLPVVSFAGRAVADLAAPVELYDPHGGDERRYRTFDDALAAVLADLDGSQAARAKRQRFACNADWRSRTDQLEAQLATAGFAGFVAARHCD